MSTSLDAKRKCSRKKSFIDLPQRVVVHKILILSEFVVSNGNENSLSPFLLFGYFKTDRLRNIWFIFSSVRLLNIDQERKCILESIIIDYSKLCNVHFFGCYPSNIVELSTQMYSLRSYSFECYGRPSGALQEEFFTESKFPKLKELSLDLLESAYSDSFYKIWEDSELFDQLKSLKLVLFGIGYDFCPFFRKKEKIFAKNLKKIIFLHIDLKEKVVISLPNIEILELCRCENLFVIPSKERLKNISIGFGMTEVESESEIVKQIARESKNAKFIHTVGSCSEHFMNLFEKENFPNLKELIFDEFDFDFYRFNIPPSKWMFSFHLEKIDVINVDLDFFRNNDWDQLERMGIKSCKKEQPVKSMNMIKFPSLRSLVVGDIFDEFFEVFEGNKLVELFFFGTSHFTGKGWSKDVFRNLKLLAFGNEFDDTFFQQNDFPNLSLLILSENDTLVDRESWREMKCLEVIDARNCAHIKPWKRE